MKKIGMVFVLALCFLLTACSDEVPRDIIVSYVSANAKVLEAFPYDEIENIYLGEEASDVKQTKEEQLMKDYLGKSTIVKMFVPTMMISYRFIAAVRGCCSTPLILDFTIPRRISPLPLNLRGVN